MKERKLFSKPSHYLIAGFVILAVSMLAFCESQAADWSVEIQHDSNAGTSDFNDGFDRVCGRATFATGTSVLFCPVAGVAARMKTESFEIAIADEFFPRWEGEIKLARHFHGRNGGTNGGLTLRRVIGDGPFQTALGVTRWIEDSFGSDTNITFNLTVRYTF